MRGSRCLKYEITVFLLATTSVIMFGLTFKNLIIYRQNMVKAGMILNEKRKPKTITIKKILPYTVDQIHYLVKGSFSSIPTKVIVTKKSNIFKVKVISDKLSYPLLVKGFGKLDNLFSIRINSACIGDGCGRDKVFVAFDLGVKRETKLQNH